jgi:hypothetical protein
VPAFGLGYPWPMTLQKRARVVTTVLACAIALGLAACGEGDVERGVEEGAKEAREAGRDAEKAGKDAAKEAEKGANEAERELPE